ncbi:MULTISPECIES: response regulator [unclassified Rhizobium]|uniref:response regulator n=1 Tax=unclassified Rhizobium TaxID=2613769 RepID=UPI0004A4291E|nr:MULTISPECIES: response regulator [unclassified Rhizobium]MBD9449041.1 response regulator [Rhizobium sp. RHZ01]MBD9453960.1 response regulator [Rhizobium sp. RHZ02]NMN73451.1 Signal transduction histidine kinase regulating C4-dicarboxylate transport system [Rhizobium sp. 57MFTsu3.2]
MERLNILLVDDQPAKLLSYEVILKDLGENLIKAQSAREALEHLLRNEIAVILADVCMPEQDGFELVSMIREHPRYQNTAIIFVSAVMMTEPDRLRGYAAGAVDYVSVPIVPDVLRAKVRVFTDLYRKTKELERLNSELEQRVSQRTAELEASSEQLRRLNEELEHRIEQRTREREEALAQLFEAQKIDTIGQLTGGVAHDFNNLLMAILGSLSLLKKRLPEDNRSERLLGNAIQAAERGSALTQRLLAFARRQELKPTTVDFEQLFANIEDLLVKAVGQGIDIKLDVAPELPSILVDANQLELALLNLFVNARDAMDGAGTIILQVDAADHPGSLSDGRYVRIRVTDDGPGMDEPTLARATEPFFTTKGPGKGTGLGLSMVQGLAAQSGGALELASRPGAGTSVSVWLPVADTSSDPVAGGRVDGASDAPPLSGELTVLVVDDDPLVSMGTVAMLEDLGHIAVEVTSASQALQLLGEEKRFDIVITDHSMPGMTGAELSRIILDSFSSLPIILASGYAELPDDQELTELIRLTKPFSQAQLKEALQQAKTPQGSTVQSGRH